MHPYSDLFRAFITQWIKDYRKTIRVTQEIMAERLRISVRCYSDLEKGRNSCYAATLMFLLLSLPEPEVVRLCEEFRNRVKEADEHGAA